MGELENFLASGADSGFSTPTFLEAINGSGDAIFGVDTSRMPANLLAYYSPDQIVAGSVMLFGGGSGNYTYSIFGLANSGNIVYQAQGICIASAVIETFRSTTKYSANVSTDIFWEDTSVGPAGTRDGGSAPGGWTDATGFGAGFANRGGGYPGLKYRRIASPAEEVEMKGSITYTGVPVAGAVIFNIPAPYRPLRIQPLVVQNSNVPANKMTVAELNPNGDLKLWDYGAGVIAINGTFSLTQDL